MPHVRARSAGGELLAVDAHVLPASVSSLDAWSRAQGLDPVQVRRMNPAFADGRVVRADRALRVLAPKPAGLSADVLAMAGSDKGAATTKAQVT